jgi:hypothetical protein
MAWELMVKPSPLQPRTVARAGATPTRWSQASRQAQFPLTASR